MSGSWPNIAWICVDDAGRVNAATLVGFMDPDALATLREAGRKPRLIDFGEDKITLFRPVPTTARVLIDADR